MSLKRKATEAIVSDTKKPKANASITSFFKPPPSAAKNPDVNAVDATTKVTGTSTESVKPAPAALKFDKQKWIAGLSSEQKDLLKLEIDTLHDSWLVHLKDEISSKEFLELKRFLKKEVDSGKTVFPPAEDVYSWYASPISCSSLCSTTQYQCQCCI